MNEQKIIEGQRIRKKTSWNNSNTVLVIQRRGRVVTDYKNWPKFCLVHYNLSPLVKLAPKSIGQFILTCFESQERFVQ